MTQTLLSPTPRPAESLTLAAADPLTNAEVDRLDAALGRAPAGLRAVVIDVAALVTVDPVAAARLVLVCERVERNRRCAVHVRGLSPALRRVLRLHPLLSFALPDETLFRDPFASFAPSRR